MERNSSVNVFFSFLGAMAKLLRRKRSWQLRTVKSGKFSWNTPQIVLPGSNKILADIIPPVILIISKLPRGCYQISLAKSKTFVSAIHLYWCFSFYLDVFVSTVALKSTIFQKPGVLCTEEHNASASTAIFVIPCYRRISFVYLRTVSKCTRTTPFRFIR